ncbi:MAG: Ni/Fe hydrogenase subunit alpha [Candidatus Thermoplasmatota archaeon]|nr:Ni/Fe hydrogenase subunit alpha [Candidatus Thermoplasmatota archaeon]
MSEDVRIKVEHLTRVEGHGNIILNSRNGRVEEIQWQVPEAPRFFEAMVVGRDYSELSIITSRICGICSIGHALASLKATESAMGVKISDQTLMLRKLALHGENIQSHILHVGYLVAPDLFGVGSVFPLINTNKEAVVKIVKVHRLANEMCDTLCGRTTHPITMVVGGFTKIPTRKELIHLKSRIEETMKTAGEVVDLVLANADRLPEFTRETEYIGLTSDDEYALYDGVISSTDTGKHEVNEYESITNEWVVPHSTAKYAKHNRESYMVGALARFNLNSAKLHPLAREVADKFGLRAPCYNPFMNSIAQLVEIVHSMEDSMKIIDELLSRGLENEKIKVEVKAGRGIGCVEVPRGILFHDYTYDKDGKCVKANCVIPTNQNHANIQKDMELFAPALLTGGKTEKEVELALEMLVRAYDPCISCSTHYLNVKFR